MSGSFKRIEILLLVCQRFWGKRKHEPFQKFQAQNMSTYWLLERLICILIEVINVIKTLH